MKRDQQRLLFLSSLGGVLEFYDFIIYALFASYITNAFFPSSHAFSGLMATFATFALGYLVRPIGGVLFGHFGDRVGRKTTFMISILMMALATIGIGIVPDYAKIGVLAPILIVILRIVQGLSVGGEIPGAITYVSEALSKQKGFACGIVFCALTMGIVLGSLVQAITTSLFTDAQMQSYGWRLPFIAGGIFGILSYFLRRELHESSQFIALKKRVEDYPILTVCKQQLGTVLAGAFMIALCAAIITSLFLFIPSYFTKVLNLPATAYIWERTGGMALGSCLTVFFGFISDKFNIKRLLLLLCVLSAVCAYPIYTAFAYYPEWYGAAFIASAILTGFSAGVIPSFLSELFPTNIRYSGIAASYNLGFAFFGGLTPVISLSIVYYSGSVTAPAAYIVIVAILAAIATCLVSRPDEMISNSAHGHNENIKSAAEA